MRFIKIIIEGFGSVIEPLIYQLDCPGLSIIQGENGAGKTTIFNALSWAIYNQLLKPKSTIEPWDHIKGNDYKGTKVEVYFNGDQPYKIIRCKGYKGKINGQNGGDKLLIYQYVDGKWVELEKLRNKDAAKVWIQKTIGYSFTLFKNTILFGQELKRLMQEDGSEKKKVFDEAFEVDFINQAKDKVQTRYNNTVREYVRQNDQYVFSKKSFAETKLQLRETFRAKKNYLSEKVRKQEDILQQIRIIQSAKKGLGKMLKENKTSPLLEGRELKRKIAALSAKIKVTLTDDEFAMNFQVNSALSRVEHLEQEISELKAEYMDKQTCSACGQKLPPKAVKVKRTKIKEQLKKLRPRLEAAKEEHNKLKGQYDDIVKGIKKQKPLMDKLKALNMKLLKAQDEHNNIKKDIAIKKALIEEKKAQLNALMNEKSNPFGIIKHLKALKEQREEEVRSQRAAVRRLKSEKNIDEWLLKDPLSNTGLKAFIFDSMLKRVNYNLIQYKNDIGFGMEVFIDLKSANKDFGISIVKNDSDVVSYYDLSKGQKQLADISLAFAINDTVTQLKPNNLILMDELFENLSKKNIEIVSNIIQSKAANKSLHLITHQSQFAPNNSHKIYLELKNERTYLAVG